VAALQLQTIGLKERWSCPMGSREKVKPSMKALCFAEGRALGHFAPAIPEADDGHLLDVPHFTCGWGSLRRSAPPPHAPLDRQIHAAAPLSTALKSTVGSALEHLDPGAQIGGDGFRSRCPISNRSLTAPRPAHDQLLAAIRAFRRHRQTPLIATMAGGVICSWPSGAERSGE